MTVSKLYCNNLHRGERTVPGVGFNSCNFVNNVKSFHCLTENSVVSVKLGAGICILDKIELGTGGLPQRVCGIASAGSGEGSL